MAKDPITSHILNTVTGRPAAEIPVTLTLLTDGEHQHTVFFANTDADGRITQWQATDEDKPIARIFTDSSSDTRLLWRLSYDVEGFYGQGKTLFKVVELTVYSDAAKDGPVHLHVPLLLGPWSYSTYRGS